METGTGAHTGSIDFQRALKLAMRRIEESAEGLDQISNASRSPSRIATSTKAKESTTVDATTEKTSATVAGNTTTMKNRGNNKDGKTTNDRRPSPAKSVEDVEHARRRPVRTVVFSGEGSGSVSSPEKPSFPDDDEEERSMMHSSMDPSSPNGAHDASAIGTVAAARRRVQRSSPAPERGMSWIEMHAQMRADGWTHVKGSDLVEWYYLHPTCRGMNKSTFLREGTEGIDYFTSIDELQRYAKLHLGWRADHPSPVATYSPADAELADRVKKRKRGATQLAARGGGTTDNSTSALKGDDVKGAGAAKKRRDGTIAKRMGVVTSTSPIGSKRQGSVSSDESSRFSQVGDGVQVRSTFDTTTVNAGAKAAAKKKTLAARSSPKSSRAERSNISTAGSVHSSGRSASSVRSSSGSGSASSGSPSGQSSVDRTYQIMSGMSAWRLLQDRFGFTYYTNKYCLPDKENRPGKDSTATEGVNYFASLDDLRRHLCAYGLPEIRKPLSDEERANLAMWVRFAHVGGLGDAALINPDDVGELLEFLEAWTMLKALGLKFSGGYMYPNPDPSKPPLRFERAEDFSAHLARFGIPRVAGIQQHEVLDERKRLRLDISIASTDIDTFARINPNSTNNVYEITPRKPRRCRSSATESTLLGLDAHKPKPTKQTLKRRPFQNEFNQMEQQRKLPIQLMKSEDALGILVECYNVEVIQRDGVKHYYLPLTESECFTEYFETLQDMRENLCAFGLPPLVKGATMSDEKWLHLESWIRCANIDALRETTVAVPQDIVLRPRDAISLLKALGYNTYTYMLPGTVSHKSKLGYDRFEKLIELTNHIARFGLDDSCNRSEPNDNFSQEDRLEFEVFVASFATFDVRKRTNELDAPIRKKRALKDHEHSVALGLPASMESRIVQKADQCNAVARVVVTATPQHVTKANSTLLSHAVAKDSVTATPSQPAVVDDECDIDTPHPSPLKKPQVNPITNFFPARQIAGDANASTLSSNIHAQTDQRHEYSPSSTSEYLSPSCIDTKGDDEVEAYLAGTPVCEATALDLENAIDAPDKGFATPQNHNGSIRYEMRQEISMDVMHYPQAESPNMPWSALWFQMRQSGWACAQGNNLVLYYWVHPSAASMKKAEMIHRCTEGIHYFTSEEAIHRYAIKNLGWEGEGVAPSPAASMLSMTSRVKKRSPENELKPDVSSPPKKSGTSLEGHNNGDTSTSRDLAPTKKIRTSPRNEKENHDASCSTSDSSAHSVNSQSIVDTEYKSLPDCQPKVKDKLEWCQMVLHPSFNKKQLSKSSSISVVSSMEHEIKDFMEKSIVTGMDMDGMTLPSPGFLYICGGPGTGKTTAVTSCAEEMTKWAKNNNYEKPIICSVNMAASQSSSNVKGGIMRAMLKKISKGLNIENDEPLAKFEKLMMKRVVVLVVDEIDMLFKQHGGIGETWFKTLVSWAEDKEMRFSLIGISNCVNDNDSARVRELGHSPRELVFPTYKEDDIVAILEQRLGKHVVDHKALQLISRRVATSSGDARRALEITSNAVGKCIDQLKDEDLEAIVQYDDQRMPLVKLPHMMRAIREAMPMRHADVISGLPQSAKVILCIAVSLGQVWGPTAKISISTLKKYCVEATKHAIMDELGPGHVMSLVEMLMDSGLLIVDDNHHFNPNDANSKLKIGVQLDDVEIALEESLLREGCFYRSLVDYVKRECPRPSGSCV